MTRNRAMFLVAVAAAVCVAILLLANDSLIWLRVVVGIPFVLLLPGQAVMLLADPDGQLGGIEWFVLSVSVSISVTVLVGMAVAVSPGLTAGDVTITLAFMIALALTAARARADFVPPRPLTVAKRSPVWRATFGATALLACTLLVLTLSIPDSHTAAASRTIQLWGLPNAHAGELHIGARNVNAGAERFRLTIEQGGRLISRQEFELSTGDTRLFVVKRSATWTTYAPVVATLADISGSLPPRQVSVWMTE